MRRLKKGRECVVCACVFVGVCACMCVRKQEGGSRDEKRGGRDGEPELRL